MSHVRRRRRNNEGLVLVGLAILQLARSSSAATGHGRKSYLSVEVPFSIHFPERRNVSNCQEFLQTLLGPHQKRLADRKVVNYKDRHSHEDHPAKKRDSLSAMLFEVFQYISSMSLHDPERTAAIETVLSMIRETHESWANLTRYSPSDRLKSLRAYLRLQNAAFYYEQSLIDNHSPVSPHSSTPLSAKVEPALLQDLAYYAKFANAVYGWKMDLALNRRLHLGGNLQSIVFNTNLSHDDIISAEWASKAHRPGYFLARDRLKKSLVLCVRGTWSSQDVLTDLCFLPDEVELPLKSTSLFGFKQKATIRAHHGMLKAAAKLNEAVHGLILHQLQLNPGFSLVLVGHSMGGGLCALLRLLQEDVPVSVKVYIFGPPCVISFRDWKLTRKADIISVTMDGDPFSRLSIGHLSDIGVAISTLCRNDYLREQIIRKCRGKVQNMDPDLLRWCSDTYAQLKEIMVNEKLVPPGRILRLSLSGPRGRRVLRVQEESPTHYLAIKAGPGMLDLQHHVPMRYQRFLGELASAALESS